VIIPEFHGQANFRFSGSAAPLGAEVTVGFVQEVGSPILVPDMAAAIADAWNDTIRLVQSSSVVLDEVHVKMGPNATGPDGSAPSGNGGAVGGDALPPSVAVLVRKTTATGGKRGRGRMYWPGVPESYVNASGALTPAVIVSWQTQCDAFLAAMDALFLPLRLFHSPGLTSVPAATPITALTVQNVAGTQRQRMRR